MKDKLSEVYKVSPTIPSSGNLGRMAKIIAEEYNEEVIDEVFQDYSTSLSGKKKAEWVLKMIKKLEQKVGLETTIKIVEQCGRQSCTKHFKNTVKQLMEESSSIYNFICKLQERYKRSSFFELVNDKTIIGGHRKCYDVIKSASKPIDSQTYCQCCVGHNKAFYESAFGKPVEVEIIETVMTGGDTCKFKINF